MSRAARRRARGRVLSPAARRSLLALLLTLAALAAYGRALTGV